jgi:altronate dehydratase
MPGDHKLYGYLRHDGRKGIRNHLVVCYLVECVHHREPWGWRSMIGL